MTLLPAEAALQDSDALFLDFDGTLAGLQEDPDAVYLADGIDDILLAINEQLEAALAVLSGRDLDDLAKRVPAALWRFGNHGLRSAAPEEAPAPMTAKAPKDLVKALETLITPHKGLRLEPKGPVIALHYRAVPELGATLAIALDRIALDFEDYKIQHGKMVFEAKPLAANKGRCLTGAMERAPFAGRRPVMIGDDTTDEDAFAAAQMAGGIAIKVGDGTTIADYRLDDVSSVHALLKEFATQ